MGKNFSVDCGQGFGKVRNRVVPCLTHQSSCFILADSRGSRTGSRLYGLPYVVMNTLRAKFKSLPLLLLNNAI
jgi:hypothetical protein